MNNFLIIALRRILCGICIILPLKPQIGLSQILLEPLHDVSVSAGESRVHMPWTGGLNSGQYNKADFDGDGSEELVIYDRSANLFLVFKIQDNQLVPAFHLADLLPEIPEGWVLFADYNLDGKKDIFTNGDRGIIVYKNITLPGQPASWQKVADPLLTTGFSGKINLIANAADVPAIADIDGDGDLDILVYNFAIGGFIRYNKNLSMELFGHADSLEYEIYTRTWGQFEECDCNLFAFNGQTCPDLANGRVMHPGGKSLLALDFDGDGDMDLLAGHEQCIELYYFENMGDRDSAFMIGFSNLFPDEINPANFYIFPSAFLEDVNFDGVKDLIVTPGFGENIGFMIDFARSNWLYVNEGTDEKPVFTFQQNDFIQSQTIDHGELSVPLLTDVDNDGRTDLLVAANGYANGVQFTGHVVFYKNTGTSMVPEFTRSDEDFIQLSSMNLANPIIGLSDFDGDDRPDLVYSGTNLQTMRLESWVFFNQSGTGLSLSLNNRMQITLPSSATFSDSPLYFDVDEDGLPDLLLGKRDGSLAYFRNTGGNSFSLEDPSFLGIERDFSQMRLNMVASIADIDKNGRADLVVTDARGVARAYMDFQAQVFGNPVSVDLVYRNEITSGAESIRFDNKSWIASADLFGLGSESILAGGTRGGLMMFKNNEKGGSDGNPVSLQVKLYPNPVANTRFLKIRSNQDITVTLYNTLGQQLLGPATVQKFITSELDVSGLQNGAFILRAVNSSGASESQLFIVHQ